MDPDAAWVTIMDGDFDARAQAALDLLVWVAMGGYLPRHLGQSPAARRRVVNTCELRILDALDRE